LSRRFFRSVAASRTPVRSARNISILALAPTLALALFEIPTRLEKSKSRSRRKSRTNGKSVWCRILPAVAVDCRLNRGSNTVWCRILPVVAAYCRCRVQMKSVCCRILPSIAGHCRSLPGARPNEICLVSDIADRCRTLPPPGPNKFTSSAIQPLGHQLPLCSHSFWNHSLPIGHYPKVCSELQRR